MTRNEPLLLAIVVVLTNSYLRTRWRDWTQFVPPGTPFPPIEFYFKGYPGTVGYPKGSGSANVRNYQQTASTDNPYDNVAAYPSVDERKALKSAAKQRVGGIPQRFASAKTKINPRKFVNPIQAQSYHRKIDSREFTNETRENGPHKVSQRTKKIEDHDYSSPLPVKSQKTLGVDRYQEVAYKNPIPKKRVKENPIKSKPMTLVSANVVDMGVGLPVKHSGSKIETTTRRIGINLDVQINESRRIPIRPADRNISDSAGFGRIDGSISEGGMEENSSTTPRSNSSQIRDPNGSEEFFQKDNRLFTPVNRSDKIKKTEGLGDREFTNEEASRAFPPPPPPPSIPAPALPRFDDSI